MQIIFILSALLATCIAKSVPLLNLTANYGYTYAYALDLAVPAPFNTYVCIKSHGYSTVFVRGYDPTGHGRFDVNAVNNIRNANQAGLGTEVFMTPQPFSSKRGGAQFKELFDNLRYNNIQVRTVWLQVTSPVNWGSDAQRNINLINDIIITANSCGVVVGFYTNAYDWSQITRNANLEGAMLWWASIGWS
ncbi:unnamed protein product [Strongylus vulgaris]|uniref:Lysozyme n=1 Tax=Strongylus vulgaris TaxID=40348 RepID=A0A3P7K833_STRVU|nr:unnamed protein product [Strongylus vulgaris]